jgi:hypothetical protein
MDSVPASAGSGEVTGHAQVLSGPGYWLVGSDGGVFSFGLPFLGSEGGKHLDKPVVGIATAPLGSGYWLGAADGGVFSFGFAAFHGSLPSLHIVPNAPVSGIAATPDGHGYWLVGQDGGVFSFGSARFYGSLPSIHIAPNKPIVGIASTPDGGGYWLVGSDGGVFSFGDAGFFGSILSIPLPAIACVNPNAVVENFCILPIVAMIPTADGKGYSLADSGGDVFALPSLVSNVSQPKSATPIVGIAATPSGNGYWLAGADGGVFSYGDAQFEGSIPGLGIHIGNIVGITGPS